MIFGRKKYFFKDGLIFRFLRFSNMLIFFVILFDILRYLLSFFFIIKKTNFNFRFFYFFFDLQRLLLKVTEVITEHQKRPKKSINSNNKKLAKKKPHLKAIALRRRYK